MRKTAIKVNKESNTKKHSVYERNKYSEVVRFRRSGPCRPALGHGQHFSKPLDFLGRQTTIFYLTKEEKKKQ